jgi:TolB-like protein/DNA-binding SARP family transcriptional activator/Tfp pilus assembly protein PilF
LFTLETFGGLSLRGADGPITSRAGQRRRLALLAVLAAERRAISRDKLLAYLWPEADGERARHLLADSLYVVRSGLGEDALQTFGDDVSLNEAIVASDVSTFLRAIDDGDPERAVAIYSGPFLDGIFISDAPEFERWVESTRSRLEGDRRRSLERLATDADARGDHSQAVTWWRALAAADPVSSRAAVGLIRALTAAGDRAAALQFARVHTELVRAELDSPADAAVTALVAELRHAPDPVAPDSRLRPGVAEPVAIVPPVVQPRVDEPTRLTPPGPFAWRWVIAGVAGIALVAIAALMIRPRVGAMPTIAVLPFKPNSAEHEADYVAGAITDELTTDLGRFRQLRIASHTSASASTLSGLASKAIGEKLRVRYLVEGGVRLAGNKIHVNARLIEASDERLLWADVFERTFAPTSVVEVEDVIARSIAAALNIRLATGPVPSLAARATTNTEAFYSNARGRHFFDNRNLDGATKAIVYFKQAIQQDSTYAEAYAGLADAYAVFAIGNIGDYDPNEYFPLARDAATRALQLDNTLAAAHASLGYFDLLYNLDWTAASRELSTALALQPSYSTAHIYRTVLAEWTGQFADAVSEAQSAREIDPLSPAANIELGRALFFAGEDTEAETILRSTLELDPNLFRAHLHLGQILVHQRHFEDGIAELKTAGRLSANSSRPLALLAYAYGAAGRTREAMQVLDSLEKRRATRYVPAFDLAIVYAGLRDTANVMRSLNESIDDHSIRPYLMDATFDDIRGAEPFRRFLTRLHLPVSKTAGK